MDQCQQFASTGGNNTSSRLLDEGWMKYFACRSADGDVPAVEHQIYASPGVVDFAAKDNFRQRLWNATMTGAYPETTVPDEAAAAQMKVWYEVMAETRQGELDPFFGAGGGNVLAFEAKLV